MIDCCHVNYDNPTKQLWRSKWKEFITKHSFASEREKMRVLCLPGKRCLEIPLYLELGIKPENIVGVEGGDDQARSEFRTNAKQFGIVVKLDRLENIINDMGVFEIISMDFTGPLSKNCLDILKKMPLAPAPDNGCNTKSFFMINLLGKRETQLSQTILDFYASFARPELTDMLSGGMNLEKFRDVYGYMSGLADKSIAGEKVYEAEALKNKRDVGFVFAITSLLGNARRAKNSIWANYAKDIPPDVDFSHYGAYVISVMLSVLSDYTTRRAIDFLTMGVPQMIHIITTYHPYLYNIEQYQYTSPVNNASSPFLTEMYHFVTPMSDYVKARYFVRFFADAIFWQASNPDKNIDLEVREKNGRRKHPSEGLRSKDAITFVDESGFVISSITWGRIIEAHNLIVNHISQDKVMDIINKGENSRINLSE